MSDEIRERLSRLDPMHPGVSTEAVTTPSSRQLLENTMSTQVEERKQARATSRWLSVAAAVAIVAVGAFALTRGEAGEPLLLSAGSDDGLASMCIAFSVEDLARAELAFEGTVVRSEGETIELSVDRWFKGGDAETVVLEAQAGMEALIGGIPFNVGDAYLITAAEGSVNYCGFSGPATPEFRSAFEAAFGG